MIVVDILFRTLSLLEFLLEKTIYGYYENIAFSNHVKSSI